MKTHGGIALEGTFVGKGQHRGGDVVTAHYDKAAATAIGYSVVEKIYVGYA
jgi:hypothetical protein